MHEWDYTGLKEREIYSIWPIENKIPFKLVEIFEEQNITLEFPESYEITAKYSEIMKLPLIIHSHPFDTKKLDLTLESIKSFINIVKNENIIKKISYNISFPIENNEVRISVLGNIEDVIEWLNNIISKPKTTKEDFFNWVNQISFYLKKKYPKNQEPSNIFNVLNSSGIF